MREEPEDYINYIKIEPEIRTNVILLKISSFLKTFKPFIDYLDEPNENELDKILLKLSENLTYLELLKGSTIKQIGEEDYNFYILLKGKVAKLSVKYNKMFLTINDYFNYIIKLQMLQETVLLNECINKNKHVYNIPNNDPISHCQNLQNFKFEDNFSSLKKLIKESKWYYYYDIKDYIELINIKKTLKLSENNIHSEPEYSFIIPEYVFNKFINAGYYINTLTEPKHVKELYCYITVKRSKFAYLDKSKINNIDYYKSIHSKQKDYLEKLFKELYIFQNIDITFIMDNFSSFFEYKVIKKGDIIIKQDTPHNGIYLIKKGLFNVKTNRTINEIDNIIHKLKHSTDNFQNYVSEFQSKGEDFNKCNFKKDLFINPILGSSEFISLSNKVKEFFLLTIEKNQIIGLNEFYDFRNGNYLFTVECISKEAEIFFVPNTIVTSLLNSYDIINNKIAIIVEQRAKFFINSLLRQKKQFERQTGELIKQNFSKTPNKQIRILSRIYKSNNNLINKTNLVSKFNIKTQFSSDLLITNKKLKDRMEEITSNYSIQNSQFEDSNEKNNIQIKKILSINKMNNTGFKFYLKNSNMNNTNSKFNINNNKLINIGSKFNLHKNNTLRIKSSIGIPYNKNKNKGKILFISPSVKNINNNKNSTIITSYSYYKNASISPFKYKIN
jgi:hypothetical protein